MEESRIVEIFQSHLAIKDQLETAATFAIENYDVYTIQEIAANYGVSFDDLQLKTYCKKYKILFLATKAKFEAVVSEYRRARQLGLTCTIKGIAKRYGISESKLQTELSKFSNPERAYEYDRYITTPYIFTFKEEMEILNQLTNWKNSQPEHIEISNNQVIQQLLHLADQSIQRKREYFQANYNRSKSHWLIDFEMKHHIELKLSGLF